jgi:hypothetical protein
MTKRERWNHSMRYRRYPGHVTSIWCMCGWRIPVPRKIVLKRDIRILWRTHLPERPCPEP